MTKLNLLGAQRVKALTEILERKFEDVIREERRKTLTDEEVLDKMIEMYGLEGKMKEAQELRRKLLEVTREINEFVPINNTTLTLKSRYEMRSSVTREVNLLSDNRVSENISSLKRELEERKSQLWLVSTLEEAQAIVSEPVKGGK